MNPFILKKRATIAIVDGRIEKEIEQSLVELGLHVIKTIKCNEVEESISYHPDIVISPINYNTLVVAPNVFDYYKDILSSFNLDIIKGEKKLKCKYPHDIAYNVGRLSNIAIHNLNYTDEIVRYYLKKENIELINVKQGYSKCSLAVVGENAAITSDKPIFIKLTALGFNMLLIRSGNISLLGQKYGFIGGTGGSLSINEYMFAGSFSEHPDKENILKFLNKNKINPISLSSKKIVDIGTIITLNSH